MIKGQRDVTYAKLRLCGVEIPLGSVVELSNFADFMCFMGLFSKCPIGALLVGAIEQVEIKALLFYQFPKKKNHKWVRFVRTTRTDFTAVPTKQPAGSTGLTIRIVQGSEHAVIFIHFNTSLV